MRETCHADTVGSNQGGRVESHSYYVIALTWRALSLKGEEIKGGREREEKREKKEREREKAEMHATVWQQREREREKKEGFFLFSFFFY